MKKLSVLIAAAVLALSAFVLPQGGAAAAATYTLRAISGRLRSRAPFPKIWSAWN